MMRLAGQVAIIVGGAGDLGRAIASTFSDEGAHVVVMDRVKPRMDEVIQRLKDKGKQAAAIAVDATDEAQVEAAVEETVQRFGRIDVLVNSAGFIGPTAPLVEVALEDWQTVLAVNLTVPFICSKAVLKRMIQQRSGSMINISGTAGKEGFPLEGAVCAAKWGLLGLTRTMAMEAGPFGIRVNAICPGGVHSQLMDHVLRERAGALGLTVDEVTKGFLERTPLRKFVTPEDVARAAVFLASSESSGTTGEALNVSGGYVMH